MILLACCKSKLTYPAPARELYAGQLFRAGLRYAVHVGAPVLILSAKYGWITLDTVIEPYNETIPYHKPYQGYFPAGNGFYVGGQQYFANAPSRYQPLVPHYHNRGTLAWQYHIKNMIAGIGCRHGFTAQVRYPCPICEK
jgi:hypothetical protein